MCVLSVPDSGNNNQAFSFPSIYKSYLKCRRNKRNSINSLRFELNAEENVLKIERELRNRTYRPSRSILFAAHKPKAREIFAAAFRDRVVHHVLISQMEKIWEPVFIHDSYACRTGKGTHKAVVRLQKFLRMITKNGNLRAYYLQLDIKDFFISINKQKLFEIIRKKLLDPDLLWLAEKTIFWDCTENYRICGNGQYLLNIPENKSLFGKNNERGLPIGNLTSQSFANIYLNELDQFVKHTLKAQFYIRYVDDFLILSTDKAQLEDFRRRIGEFLKDRLILRLHPRRQKLRPVSDGIDFLGYIVRPSHVLVRRRVVNNFKAKIRQFKSMTPMDIEASVASYHGHFKWANSFRLRGRLNNRISKLMEDGDFKAICNQ